MKAKINHATVSLLVFVVLALTVLWATGNLHIGPATAGTLDAQGQETRGASEEACGDCDPVVAIAPEAECGDCEEEAVHNEAGESDAQDHGGEIASVDVEAIFEIECEHVIKIVDCDECRYEVGVVKVDTSVTDALTETQVPSLRNLSDALTLTGKIEFDGTKVVEVAAAGKGRVLSIEKFIGQQVKKGDVLAIVHSAELGQAKAEYLATHARLELAEVTFIREKNLYEKKISSRDDYLKAQNELKGAQACLAADEKNLNLFGLEDEQIAAINDEKKNGDFAQLVLRATTDGTIIEQNITVGKLIDTTDTLYIIADLSNVWVWCDLYEKNLAQMHKLLSKNDSLKATIKVSAFGDIQFEGTVDLITSKMDSETRTVKMRLQAKNVDRMLKPGMFADISIPLDQSKEALAVPKTAIMTDEGESFVFQHLKDDFWIRRDVVTGKAANGYVEIIKGIANNERVITKGAFMFKSDVLREKMGAGCAH